MSDYDTDIVAWSEQQADALRQRDMSAIDWPNVIEEIETVGRAETSTVADLLVEAVARKLKLLGWPDHASANHWRAEIRAWLVRAAKKHRPSMKIEIADVFEDAFLAVEVTMLDLPPGTPLPNVCPWTIDGLLVEGRSTRRRS